VKRTMTSLALAAAVLGAAMGCVNIDLAGLAGGPLQEQVVYGEKGPKLLLVDVDGVLSEQGESAALGVVRRESIVSRVREQLDRAAEDDGVRGVILRIHSPGGTATASEILYDEIQRFKEERKVPVVAQLMGVAASGGFYVAMAADTVRAYPTSVTGSIGVIFAGVNLSGLLDKIGVEDQTLTSGAFKDAGSPLRPMRPEERAQLQTVVDDLYGRFVEVVDRGRPSLSEAEVRALADGRIYSGPQALAAGLVDALGDLPDAVEETKARAGLEEARVVVYHRPGERPENLFSMQAPPASMGGGTALERVTGQLGPGFLYLWWPGEGGGS